MKKISIITAMAALLLCVTSCKQEDEPKYHNPTEFRVNVPALQNQVLQLSSDMGSTSTFNLFCSQPDYGYSAICKYSALVSLDPECPADDAAKTLSLPTTNPSMAAMAIKTYELAVALNKLKGYNSIEEYQTGYDGKPLKAYFRAVCEIPSIEGSRIVSSNVVSYNLIPLIYAEKKAAWIWILGDVQTVDGEFKNGFAAPSAANAELYEHFKLFEPEEHIGEKLFVGIFSMVPKKDNPDPNNPDDCSSFRFAIELGGWDYKIFLGAEGGEEDKHGDFFTNKITDKLKGGKFYNGTVKNEWQANWGIATGKVLPCTFVVDTENMKLYVKEGENNVTFSGREPQFSAK